MSIIEELARNISETSFSTFNREVVAQAKNRIIDTIGCLIAGANAPGCSTMVDLVKEWGGKEESTILVHGGRAPAYNVAMVNSVMARSLDFEPVEIYIDGVSVPSHISATTVPTALTVAEKKAVSGKELITALILGDDISSRIRAATGSADRPGWDTTGTTNVFGATAIAGRLLGLDKRQMLNAFGIALNQLAGTFQNIYDGAHSFKLTSALAARAGVFSAELARRGFTGVQDPLFSKFGYFALYGRAQWLEILTKELGKKFYSDTIFKPYPCCRGTHAAIDCSLEIVRNHDIRPGDIAEINVNTALGRSDVFSFLLQPFIIGEVPQVNAKFSLQYTAANAIMRRGVKSEHFTDEFIREPEMGALIKKVELNTTLPPEKPSSAVEVRVSMKDGRVFSAQRDTPTGHPVDSPMTEKEIKAKFWTNVAFTKTVSKEHAEEALDMLEKLDEVDDVTRVVNLLVA